jgi:hypothetical protein
MLQYLRQIIVLTLFLALSASASAGADNFVTMPEAKASTENLKIRFIEYDGSTNGAMVVEVKNTGRTSAKFDSDGLFFVPKGDPEKAPQRLGAAGPFTEIAGKKQIVRQDGELAIAAGETKRLRLEVFCIDSHRSSPSTSTKFTIANKKLPKSLRKELKTSNQQIYRSNKGDLKKSKSAVQSNMWKTRDKKWIKLEGERAQEKKPQSKMQNRQAPQRRNAPVQRQQLQNKLESP